MIHNFFLYVTYRFDSIPALVDLSFSLFLIFFCASQTFLFSFNVAWKKIHFDYRKKEFYITPLFCLQNECIQMWKNGGAV